MAVLVALAEAVVTQVHPRVLGLLAAQFGVGRHTGHREGLLGITLHIMSAVLPPIMQAAV